MFPLSRQKGFLMKQKFFVLFSCILCILAGILSSCASPRENEKRTVTGLYFDTVIQIEAWGTTETVLEHCLEICADYENRFSNKIPGSEISKINAAAGAPVPVSKDTLDLISKGLYYSQLSGGKFDITIAPLSDLWDFKDPEKKTIPDPASMEEACSHVDYKKVSVDRKSGTVTLLDPHARLDLGGIAKGYIADRLKVYLKGEGVEHALINLGGNVLALGQTYDERPFRIGIRKPFDKKNTPIDTLEIDDCSVVTSGIDQRYFEAQGKIYHHILNPMTGYPYENDLLQVTILSESSADGDALSTCCFALGLEKGSDLITSLEDVRAVFITKDYQLHVVGTPPKADSP